MEELIFMPLLVRAHGFVIILRPAGWIHGKMSMASALNKSETPKILNTSVSSYGDGGPHHTDPDCVWDLVLTIFGMLQRQVCSYFNRTNSRALQGTVLFIYAVWATCGELWIFELVGAYTEFLTPTEICLKRDKLYKWIQIWRRRLADRAR